MRIFLNPVALTFLAGLAPLALSAAVFLPTTSGGNWSEPSNWNTGVVPNGVDETAAITMNAADDREVILDVPITLGSLLIDNFTGFRDQLEGVGSLTFASGAGEASIVVGGDGEGFSELNLDGVVTFQSDVRVTVNNVTSNGEYGALRIREVVEGTGGLIKDGYGILSLTGGDKNFTGPTVIEEGVLRITQSAELGSSSSVSVEPGGQLRLVSHGEGNEYNFGGRLRLDSFGQDGPVELPQKGRLGALRLDPELEIREDESESGVHTATVTAEIEIVGDSHIHVDGSDNWLFLSGDMLGGGAVFKSGGGTLVFVGDNGALTGGTYLESGTIRVDPGSSIGTGPLGFDGLEEERIDLILENATQTVSRLESDLGGSSTAVITLGAGATLIVDQDGNSSFGGTLTGVGSFSKAGTGRLVLSGNHMLTGAVTVSGGDLQINGHVGTASGISVREGARLTGTGSVSGLQGGGAISPGDDSAGILEAVTFDGTGGLDLELDFGQAGSPSYLNPTASGNDLLWLTGAMPFTEPLTAENTISIYLEAVEITESLSFRGGFFTGATGDFSEVLQGARLRIYVEDPTGDVHRAGLDYHLYEGPLLGELNTVAENGGRVMELSWTSRADFSDWREAHFPDPTDFGNDEVSGPAGDANGDGIANLIAYALDLGPWENVGSERLSTLLDDEGRLVTRFYRDAAKSDIAYVVEASTDLRDWQTVFDSRAFSGSNSSGEFHEVLVPTDAEPVAADSLFVRLRIVQLP